MICFDQVHKSYPGGYAALAGVSFDISRGELVVLSGHSGAGKSTLLKLIAAIERPSSGVIHISGNDVSRLLPTAVPYLRRSMGLVFQETRLLQDRNVFDNVMLPLIITGHPPRDASRRVAVALKRVGLIGREKDAPVALSGGEQQRVAIARAIVNRPSILIADEPTAHLDNAYAGEIAKLFRSFNDAGVTVIVSTHDEYLFAGQASRYLILSRGELIRNELC